MKKVLLGLFGFLLVLGWIGKACGGDVPSANQAPLPATDNSAAPAPEALTPNWTYETYEDKMDGTKQRVAVTTSTNKVHFDFPYAGGSEFYLMLRKGGGTDVMLKISKGQFMSGLTDEVVRVKCDNGTAVSYGYNGAADGSSDIIFLNGAKGLIEKIRKSKKVMIDAPFYNAGRQVAEFEVEGLEF